MVGYVECEILRKVRVVARVEKSESGVALHVNVGESSVHGI